jgi:glycosyltransferase involved in cell wall biosynthesis
VPDAYLLVVGEGPFRDSLQQKIQELRLHDFVRIVAPISTNEVPRYFSICDVHIAPSIVTKDFIEPFGLVYLEAMASGKPSVAFDIPAPVNSIVDNGVTGYLVKEKSVDELAEKMCYLLKNENARISMGKRAKGRCVKNYNRELVAQKWIIVLLKMMNLR